MDPDKRLLRKALWSVCCHSNDREASRLRPMPLSDALEIIFDSADHPIEHTRWALQKLTKDDVPRHVKAQALQAVKRARLPALATACKSPAPSGALMLDDVWSRFETATTEGSCSFDIGPCKTEIDPISGTVHLVSESTAHKPIDQCRATLDPRNWGRCSPYFDPEKTYEIRRDAQGRPARTARGDLIKEQSSAMGEPWKGLLRERFDGEGVATENILDIEFAVHKSGGAISKVEMLYSLYSCDYCQLGFLAEPGGLRKNSGGMVAVPHPDHPDWTNVTVTKHVRYKDFTPGNPGRFFDLGDTLNVWASVLLCARADGEAVFNLCCD